jgi:hypothetical protein
MLSSAFFFFPFFFCFSVVRFRNNAVLDLIHALLFCQIYFLYRVQTSPSTPHRIGISLKNRRSHLTLLMLHSHSLHMPSNVVVFKATLRIHGTHSSPQAPPAPFARFFTETASFSQVLMLRVWGVACLPNTTRQCTVFSACWLQSQTWREQRDECD